MQSFIYIGFPFLSSSSLLLLLLLLLVLFFTLFNWGSESDIYMYFMRIGNTIFKSIPYTYDESKIILHIWIWLSSAIRMLPEEWYTELPQTEETRAGDDDDDDDEDDDDDKV